MENNNKQISIKSVFEEENVKKRFYDMLGKKAEGFLVSVMSVVQNDKALANADRNSILFAAATAATLDLPVNPNLGFAYILAYKGKDGIQRAQFQMGYKGFIQLAQRSGQFKTISASPIYEGQLMEENPLTGYKFDFTKKVSDKVIGYAGYFEMINGFQKTLYMTVEELKAHGVKYSQTFKKGYGLWSDNFDAMATKTVLKLLLSKFAPLSIDMQKAVVTDQAVVNDWEGQSLDYADNEPEKLEDINQQKEEARIKDFIVNAKTLNDLKQAEKYCDDLPLDHELTTLYTIKLDELTKKEAKK